MNLNRLTLGSRIIAIAGIALFIDSFLPWFRICIDLSSFGQGKQCASHNGWANALTLLAVLIAIAMVAVVLIEASGNTLPAMGSLTWGQLLLGAGAVTFLFVLLQLIIGDDGAPRSFGLFIGLVLTAALAYGGFLRSREPATRPLI